LYKEFGVPIVISTDDAGILRTNMTEQYVLLAKRYKTVSYTDIKQFVYNSIYYSFIQDPAVKKQLVQDLDNRFKAFEANFPN
jgi:adenosine deaminase/adenosine deaminase CECR1